MASRRSDAQEDRYLRTLRLIQETPDISHRDLARRIGISVGAAHYCLSALAEKGLIKLTNFYASNNRRGYVYLLTPEGMSAKTAMTVKFLHRKVKEYEALRAEIEALSQEVEKSDKGSDKGHV